MSRKKKNIESETGVYTISPKLEKETKQKKLANSKIVYTLYGYNTGTEDGYPVLIDKNADNNHLAFAKRQTIDNITEYFIKIDASGMLFNPISASPNMDHPKVKLLKEKTGKFVKVLETTFNYYLDFLKTKNTLYLKFSERSR